MNKIIVFGTGDIAELAHFYFSNDSKYEVVAFTVDKEYLSAKTLLNLPVIGFENIEYEYPPSEYKMFIALSYARMNKLREEKYSLAKEKGYTLVSYISSRCSYLSQYSCGDNCFILEDNTIQPFVKIGNNVTLWSGNHIGHHSEISNHNFISSHVVISGHCFIENNCFLGVNVTLAHKIIIAKETLLGAGVVVTKNTEAGGVYVSPRPIKLDKNSCQISL